MNTAQGRSGRRAFLGTIALGASAFTSVRGSFADELTRTPIARDQ